MPMRMFFRRCFALTLGVAGAMALNCGRLQAASLMVPNASFELPATGYASPLIESWQKSPKPDWYDEGGGFLWTQLVGAFRNTAPTSNDYIDNCDGSQASWLFAVREVGLFQDYNSVDWNDPVPSHAFDARFEVGRSYRLTVGIIGGGGGMLDGVTLELGLYYRDTASNRVTVAATTVTNTPSVFPSNTHFIDFQVNVLAVKPGDAWANQRLGIEIRSSITTTNLEGGYWDLDNVRLEDFPGPMLAGSLSTNGQFQIALHSEPGLRFEILGATNLSQPLSDWSSLGLVTNLSGTAFFTDSTTNAGQRFYQALQRP